MPYSEIKRKLAQRLKTPNLDTNTAQAQIVLDLVNDAAREIYDKEETLDMLAEITTRVTDERELALPPYVGELKGARLARENYGSSASYVGHEHGKWSLLDMRPRYQIKEWRDLDKNLRLKGYSPLAYGVGAGTRLTFTLTISEPEAVYITIIGSTTEAYEHKEIVELSNCDEGVTTVATFTAVDSIKKSKVTQGDILITDLGGNDLGVIYNTRKESSFLIAEVSQYPQFENREEQLLDVLYKKAFIPFTGDKDQEFIAYGFDDLIVDKAEFLDSLRQPGKTDYAKTLDSAFKRKMGNRNRNRTGAIRRGLQFRRNPIYGYAKRFSPKRTDSSEWTLD